MGKLIVMQNRCVKLHVMNWKSGEIDDSEDIYNSGITYDSQPDLKGFLKKCYEPIEKYGLIHYIGKLEVGHLKYIYIYFCIRHWGGRIRAEEYPLGLKFMEMRCQKKRKQVERWMFWRWTTVLRNPRVSPKY